MELRVILVQVITIWSIGYCQANTGNNVGAQVSQCYNNTALPGITTANERPPASLNLFIEFIRKLEDANPTMTPRELALHILHRLRQDGITQTGRTIDERFGLAYSASRPERYKFRVLLQSLLPNAEQTLASGQLSDFERCSLHYLISNTIADMQRENEALECSRSSRYTLRIHHRRRREDDDTEDTELVNQDSGGNLGLLSTNVARNLSQCPIELGVVQTQSGTIKAGNVLAGIAAGLNPQTVGNGTVDNRYAATIIGELAEASLYQADPTISLGASGGWNSTINPKYFFLQNNNLLQATDAELRGALDGLYISLRMTNLTSAFADLKISQIIDMYYSPYDKGVFDSSFKACNRNILYTEMTTSETMRTQLLNFMPLLNTAALSGISLTRDAFEVLSNSSISAFGSYLPQMTSADLTCATNLSIERVKTDLLIFIDSGWQFGTLQSVLSYILNNIDVNPFQSKYTLYGGTSLRNLTANGTSYLSDFFLQYNQTVHANETAGFNYVDIFQTLESYGYQKLNDASYAGGESTVALLVPRTSLTDDQRTFLTQRRQVFNAYLPDVNFLVLGSGAASDYSTIVSNTRDVVILQDTIVEETLISLGQQVVNNIKDVPRALVNPACTSQFTGASSTFFITGYVEPNGINYYRISPNYFYSGGDTRNLILREQGHGAVSICIARGTRPDNSTGDNCRTLSSAEEAIDITSYCDGNSVTECQPIFLSVAGVSSNIVCSAAACRYPNDIAYSITMENVGCNTSGSIAATASVILVILLCALARFS
ncbi:uncharacterized protein LOC109540976 [Dendroctonus ponderosae]|uniref:Uncharacterized protein n=2 Tax=Dendroctonus ponderosae TaxID=77166 RepID=A0AAR5PVV6_DENPD|nr:uncharacterized protein LOC109540976 [Dendroctonus ponderosae]XP_019765143.1 uncharacterized protein LOC109540976 [Dendroctonus ponderosae]